MTELDHSAREIVEKVLKEPHITNPRNPNFICEDCKHFFKLGSVVPKCKKGLEPLRVKRLGICSKYETEEILGKGGLFPNLTG